VALLRGTHRSYKAPIRRSPNGACTRWRQFAVQIAGGSVTRRMVDEIWPDLARESAKQLQASSPLVGRTEVECRRVENEPASGRRQIDRSTGPDPAKCRHRRNAELRENLWNLGVAAAAATSIGMPARVAEGLDRSGSRSKAITVRQESTRSASAPVAPPTPSVQSTNTTLAPVEGGGSTVVQHFTGTCTARKLIRGFRLIQTALAAHLPKWHTCTIRGEAAWPKASVASRRLRQFRSQATSLLERSFRKPRMRLKPVAVPASPGSSSDPNVFPVRVCLRPRNLYHRG